MAIGVCGPEKCRRALEGVFLQAERWEAELQKNELELLQRHIFLSMTESGAERTYQQ